MVLAMYSAQLLPTCGDPLTLPIQINTIHLGLHSLRRDMGRGCANTDRTKAYTTAAAASGSWAGTAKLKGGWVTLHSCIRTTQFNTFGT